MRLQLALDRLSRDRCIEIVGATKDIVDIIEIGTGVIKEYGVSIIREIRELFPSRTILADMKTCDAGKQEAKQAFAAGADITTVMAFSADQTIQDTLEVAKGMDGIIMVDLLEIQTPDRVKQLEHLGVELVCLHVGKDQQTSERFDSKLFSLTAGTDLEVAVAGGIDQKTLPGIVTHQPDIVIVGSAITGNADVAQAAKQLKRQIS
ncbi:3-hexulose-6-phosphate synthase [Gracilibacillus timonensis]|uniref:3-hexulose-6-phosphate synthase n=1 Tax=Gracilibacillus timonensis TaxID=1816696 RepID=UPI000825A897|nr:3-hexulose-6-phosphate synthase [Gracilibacillus timonensis]